MSEDTQEQKFARKLLDNITKWFSRKKKIKAMKVKAGTQVFWCKKPKTISYWKTMAEVSARHAFEKSNRAAVQIKRVLYE